MLIFKVIMFALGILNNLLRDGDVKTGRD